MHHLSKSHQTNECTAPLLQEFMLGDQLRYGEGVSWPTVTAQQQTYVEDVATREGMKMFR